MVLDRLVPKGRYADVSDLLDERPVLTVATAPLEHDLSSHGRSDDEIEQATRALALHVSGVYSFTAYAKAYHPWLWCSTIGTERSQILAGTAMRIFCLAAISAGVERTFKIRSGIHGKNRVQLSNDKADNQFHVIYIRCSYICLALVSWLQREVKVSKPCWLLDTKNLSM